METQENFLIERDPVMMADGNPIPTLDRFKKFAALAMVKTSSQYCTGANKSKSPLATLLASGQLNVLGVDNHMEGYLGEVLEHIGTSDWRTYSIQTCFMTQERAIDSVTNAFYSHVARIMMVSLALWATSKSDGPDFIPFIDSLNLSIVSWDRITDYSDANKTSYAWTDHARRRAFDMSIPSYKVDPLLRSDMSGHSRIFCVVMDFLDWFSARYSISPGFYQSFFETVGTSNWHFGYFDKGVCDHGQLLSRRQARVDCSAQGTGGIDFSYQMRTAWGNVFHQDAGYETSRDARLACVMLANLCPWEVAHSYMEAVRAGNAHDHGTVGSSSSAMAICEYNNYRTGGPGPDIPDAWLANWINSAPKPVSDKALDRAWIDRTAQTMRLRAQALSLPTASLTGLVVESPNATIREHITLDFRNDWKRFCEQEEKEKAKQKQQMQLNNR